jgi:hypothetical protein
MVLYIIVTASTKSNPIKFDSTLNFMTENKSFPPFILKIDKRHKTFPKTL